MKLRLADHLALPLDAVTQTFAILGVRGSGKTNTGVVLVEELLEAGQQVVVIDPVDVWWGLKSSGDGKKPAFAVPIIGGEHGDVPLEGAGGIVIADFVVDTRASAIISVRHLSMNDQRRFAADFARRLYERKGPAEFRSPMMLVVDEADEFMPQRIPSGYEAMFGAFDRIVRRGRSSGLGVVAITQRPQVLNKDILSQMETLVAHRVLHKLDRGALDAWIEAHDTEGRREEFMSSLASLERGDAWIWSPSWLGVFKRVHIRARNTFDSSATPKAGEHIAPPKKIAEIDLNQLSEKLKETIEKQKADDPRELRKHIHTLQLELKQIKSAAPAADPEALKKEFARGADSVKRELAPDLRRYHASMAKTITDTIGHLQNIASRLMASADEIRAIPEFPRSLDSIIEEVKYAPIPITGPRVNRPAHSARPAPEEHRAANHRSTVDRTSTLADVSQQLPAGERTVLVAVANYEEGISKNSLCIITGYKARTRNDYILRLRNRGFVEDQGELVTATAKGIAALGDFEPLPRGEKLQEYWLNKLPAGERRILEILLKHPNGIDRAAIDEATGYAPRTRNDYLSRLVARKVIKTNGGQVAPSQELFG